MYGEPEQIFHCLFPAAASNASTSAGDGGSTTLLSASDLSLVARSSYQRYRVNLSTHRLRLHQVLTAGKITGCNCFKVVFWL